MERRSFIKGTFALATIGLLNPILFRHGLSAAEDAIEIPYKDALDEYLRGKKVEDGSKIMSLNIPDAPENGAVVPVEVTVDYPMKADDYISNITVLTTKNKANKAISFDLTPANGMAYLYVNVKMGQTQDVVILAQTNKGRIFQSSKNVRVALGGCG
ncbi:MAG: thiosulfate oxidation carrier protein SoxY [Sulfuricurvum sp.]|nr:thiosulfate oxidation carrier protein SoxY [Sulfuricurvum sp.]